MISILVVSGIGMLAPRFLGCRPGGVQMGDDWGGLQRESSLSLTPLPIPLPGLFLAFVPSLFCFLHEAIHRQGEN